MAWRRIGDKLYLNRSWPDSLTHICGTRGRWVKTRVNVIFGDVQIQYLSATITECKICHSFIQWIKSLTAWIELEKYRRVGRLHEELCVRSRYQGQGHVITYHNVCGNVITCPCPWYLLLPHKFLYVTYPSICEVECGDLLIRKNSIMKIPYDVKHGVE